MKAWLTHVRPAARNVKNTELALTDLEEHFQKGLPPKNIDCDPPKTGFAVSALGDAPAPARSQPKT